MPRQATKWTKHHDSGLWVAYGECEVIEAICMGERMAHAADGKYFRDSHFFGSYADNWHGGPRGSLEDLADWVREAEYPIYKHTLWNPGSRRTENAYYEGRS